MLGFYLKIILECIDLMLATTNLSCLIGNHEQYFLQGIPTPQPQYMSDGEVIHQSWVHQQLGEQRKAHISKWEMIISRELQGVKVCFQHYAFLSDSKDFLGIIRNPTAADLDKLFENIEADILFYGHAHKASDIQGKKRYINPGSLGCNPKAVAKYSVAEIEDGNLNIEHREIPYDDVELFRAFEERNVPEREFIQKIFFCGRYDEYET